ILHGRAQGASACCYGGALLPSLSRFTLFLLLSFVAGNLSRLARGGPPHDHSNDPVNALETVIKDEWEYEMRRNPVVATMYGDYRYNDKLDDFSLVRFQEDRRAFAGFLARTEAIRVAGLTEQQRLNKTL